MSTCVLTEAKFAEIVAQNGGRVYRVGGCVRDSIMGIPPQDMNYCIVGMVRKNFQMLFSESEDCGKAYPVFHLVIDGMKREAAFARTEQKAGNGVKISAKPRITIEEDLFRRDTTVNSMAQDCLTGEIIDPCHGRTDLAARILRANGPHFADKPLRALKIAGQAARLGFAIDSDTLPLVAAVREELAHVPAERMTAELISVLSDAQAPGCFFRVLAETGLLPVSFKEIADLPAEVFIQAMDGLDLAAKATPNAKVRFAALGVVLDQESLGLWSQRMKLPVSWTEGALAVRQTVVFLESPTAAKLVDSINKLKRGALTLEEFDLITKATGLKIPQLGPLKAGMVLPPGEAVPENLKGKEIGEWLRQKHVKAIEANYGSYLQLKS
ncbi:polynucleotide adenylyltransferase [Sporomusa aerivorans]|uniref:polynucleotide adenylyltransferase n=1 Tax=Sporomusa aerivorans TaxID=204936 RepID=UPI003529E78F